MNNVEKNKLLESIKDKSYFNKAKEWYYHRYLFCITERAWLLLIVLFLLVCVSLLTMNIYLLFPITKHPNFVIYAAHADDEFSLKKKLSVSHKENEHVTIARYLVQKYIELYEAYQVVETSLQENFIKNHSIRQVHKNFHEKMLNEVSTHPKKVLHTEVRKLSVEQPILNLEMFTGNATVTFITEQNKKTMEQTVEVNFTLSNIQETLNRVTPFRFIVKNYELKSG
ncbi:conjugal transfer protein TraJ [Wolbachia pipientis]|uniref:Conjugal transfer protein TraJ n=1 Tax=Wolbachia pipientis TaxID=955 RepID=A0A1E7QJE8_WOLPI|nr:VirB8/TrbF family protein [Wolbachia pipientis]OEY86602.1 conjugal transfer protein TraJ [Wolbachia pipientis]